MENTKLADEARGYNADELIKPISGLVDWYSPTRLGNVVIKEITRRLRAYDRIVKYTGELIASVN